MFHIAFECMHRTVEVTSTPWLIYDTVKTSVRGTPLLTPIFGKHLQNAPVNVRQRVLASFSSECVEKTFTWYFFQNTVLHLPSYWHIHLIDTPDKSVFVHIFPPYSTRQVNVKYIRIRSIDWLFGHVGVHDYCLCWTSFEHGPIEHDKTYNTLNP